jgi:Ribonuclease G/E
MSKEMIISANGHETQVAILRRIRQRDFRRAQRQRGVVGNVYKGRVSRCCRHAVRVH